MYSSPKMSRVRGFSTSFRVHSIDPLLLLHLKIFTVPTHGWEVRVLCDNFKTVISFSLIVSKTSRRFSSPSSFFRLQSFSSAHQHKDLIFPNIQKSSSVWHHSHSLTAAKYICIAIALLLKYYQLRLNYWMNNIWRKRVLMQRCCREVMQVCCQINIQCDILLLSRICIALNYWYTLSRSSFIFHQLLWSVLQGCLRMVYSLVYFFWHEESVETCHRSETCGTNINWEQAVVSAWWKKLFLHTQDETSLLLQFGFTERTQIVY